MGHTRIGRLPATRRWRQVIDLIGGGADVMQVASATAIAAEQALARAGDDPLLRRAVWLLTQIPLAARKDNFAAELRRLGLSVSHGPTLVEICAAMVGALDRLVSRHGRRGDFGEMAVLCAAESLTAVVGQQATDMLGPSYAAEATRAALRQHSTMKQFGILARDFFARLTRRCLDYFLSRELPRHVGINQRFHSLHEHRAFEQALNDHCAEASRIMQDYAADWFSKANYEGGIDEGKAGRFAHVAFGKVCAELRVRREVHA